MARAVRVSLFKQRQAARLQDKPAPVVTGEHYRHPEADVSWASPHWHGHPTTHLLPHLKCWAAYSLQQQHWPGHLVLPSSRPTIF